MQKTLIFDLARMPYLRPKVHAMDFKRFSPSENAKNFDKKPYVIIPKGDSTKHKASAQIEIAPVCALQVY